MAKLKFRAVFFVGLAVVIVMYIFATYPLLMGERGSKNSSSTSVAQNIESHGLRNEINPLIHEIEMLTKEYQDIISQLETIRGDNPSKAAETSLFEEHKTDNNSLPSTTTITTGSDIASSVVTTTSSPVPKDPPKALEQPPM